MLAPYPDRLRSSRSTSAQSSPNVNSTSSTAPTPTPPPSHVLSTTPPSSQHRLFSSHSSLPLTRMRTNSLSSPSPSRHFDSPSPSTDHAPPRPSRNSSRRPASHRRPSTSSGVPDQKHQHVVPIVVTSPSSAAPFPVSLSVHQLSSLVYYAPCSPFPNSYLLVERVPKSPHLHATRAPPVLPPWIRLRGTPVSPLLTVLSLKNSNSVPLPASLNLN